MFLLKVYRNKKNKFWIEKNSPLFPATPPNSLKEHTLYPKTLQQKFLIETVEQEGKKKIRKFQCAKNYYLSKLTPKTFFSFVFRAHKMNEIFTKIHESLSFLTLILVSNFSKYFRLFLWLVFRVNLLITHPKLLLFNLFSFGN